MAKERKQLTQEEYDELQRERVELVEVKIPQTRDDLNLARSQGDLSENEDYKAAKTALGNYESRLSELDEQLANAEIVTKIGGSDIVGIGSMIIVNDGVEEFKIKIGGNEGAKPFDEIVSVSNVSPFGKAVIGHRAGDVVTVEAEEKYNVTIVSIVE